MEARSGALVLWSFRALALALMVAASAREARAEIVDVVCAVQPNNSMRFDCSIVMAGNREVRLGHRNVLESDWTWVYGDGALPAHGLTVYGVVPGQTYFYRVEDTGDGDAVQDLLTIPSLPVGLADLTMATSGTAKSRYVLFDTEGCDDKQYLVLWDTVRDVVTWYLDVQAETAGIDISGFDVVPSLTDPTDRNILLMLDNRNVYEFNWSGKLVSVLGSDGPVDPWPSCETGMNGPCPHHDLTRDQAGYLWTVGARIDVESPLVAPWDLVCLGETSFVNDGLMKVAGGLVIDSDWLMNELVHDPASYPGPTPEDVPCSYGDFSDQLGRSNLIDWTHVNSIDRVPGSGAGILLSLAEHGEIVFYNANTDTVIWGVATDGRPTDLTVSLHPGRTFNFNTVAYSEDDQERWDYQHDVHSVVGGAIDFFDNHAEWDSAQSRVVRLRVEYPNAYIMASWNFPFDPMDLDKYACNSRGSARVVPGTAVVSADPQSVPHYYGTMLALCAKTNSVIELTADDGTPAPLGYELTIAPSACSSDPGRVTEGWHRAYPIMSLGQD